jgi:hypothetical protein
MNILDPSDKLHKPLHCEPVPEAMHVAVEKAERHVAAVKADKNPAALKAEQDAAAATAYCEDDRPPRCPAQPSETSSISLLITRNY